MGELLPESGARQQKQFPGLDALDRVLSQNRKDAPEPSPNASSQIRDEGKALQKTGVIPNLEITTVPGAEKNAVKDRQAPLEPRQGLESRTSYSGPKYPDGKTWTGSNFNTDKNLSLSTVQEGHTVEIDPFGHPLSSSFIKAAQDKGARVVAYLPGGHCYKSGGLDGCDQYKDPQIEKKHGKAIEFGKTGAVWENKDERRIQDQSHPAFIARQEERMMDVFKLGANGIRYDNLHSPEGGSKATREQVEAIYGAFLRTRDKFIKQGGVEPKGGFGLVPHNSMPIWEELINAGKVNPKDIFMLGLERTTQLGGDADPLNHPEIAAALRIAKKHNLGVAITNFQLEHTLDKSGKAISVDLNTHHADYQEKVVQACTKAGIRCQVTTVPDEDNYYSFDSAGRKKASIRFTK